MAEAQISVVEVETNGIAVVEVTIPGPQGGGGSGGGAATSLDPALFSEIATPGSPAANTAYLFLRDDGAGVSQLCVKFANGNVLVIGQDT